LTHEILKELCEKKLVQIIVSAATLYRLSVVNKVNENPLIFCERFSKTFQQTLPEISKIGFLLNR